jgi:DNA-binding MarR family transcriptional regulator
MDTTISTVQQQCVAVRLRLITRAVTRIYNKALRPHGITISQMNILVAISSLGEANQQKISRALQLEKSTLSRDTQRMIENGWIVSLAGEDARSTVLRMTPEGTRLLKKTVPAWQSAQEQAMELIGRSGVENLHRAAGKLGLRQFS